MTDYWVERGGERLILGFVIAVPIVVSIEVSLVAIVVIGMDEGLW